MVLEGDGRFTKPTAIRSMIYVSQKVATDSAFPFVEGQKLRIRIDRKGRRLIVEAAPDA